VTPVAKKLIFLADVHLCPEHPQRTTALCSFLQQHRNHTLAFYIIGDLVDFWVGPRQLRLAPWAAIFQQLAKAAAGGPPVRVLGGNRDYLLDNTTLAPHGLQALGLQHSFDHDGLRFTLVHGHMHFPDGRFSRAFLRFIQGRFMRWMARVSPLWACLSVAAVLRWWRRLVGHRKHPRDARRYDPAAFTPLFDAGANVVVCGHNHWAHDYTPQLARPGCRLFALGPWQPGPSWLEYADGTFRLCHPGVQDPLHSVSSAPPRE